MYDNWYDAVHRYRMRLPHHPNSTHDEACNDVVEQDMYWDDDSDKPYEAYMDHWCGMVYPQGEPPLCCLLIKSAAFQSNQLPFGQICCLSAQVCCFSISSAAC